MWDNDSVFPKIESGYTFTPHKDDVFCNNFNIQTYNQDGKDSAILKIRYYDPPKLIFQHLSIKEKAKNIQVNRMRIGFIIDTLPLVDICETVERGGKVEFCEGVICRENFKISAFRKVIKKLYNLKRKYKSEKNDFKQGLLKLVMKSLYGVQIRKDITESYYCKSEIWMKTEYDENVFVYRQLSNENHMVKMKEDDGIDDDCDIKNTLPAHLRAFILSNSKRIMKKYIRKIEGFHTNNIACSDTDSLYIERKHWDDLDKAKLAVEKFVKARMTFKMMVLSMYCFYHQN